MKRLGQQNLLRQVLRIEWTEPLQLFNHSRSDSLRRVARSWAPQDCQDKEYEAGPAPSVR